MKKYESPEIVIVRFAAQDILNFSEEFNFPGVPVENEGQEQ